MKPQPRHKQAWAKWRKLISQQANSQQSVAAFCRERGLCAPHFFEWRKRLQQVQAGKLDKFVEVKIAAPVMAAPETALVPAIQINLGNGRCLRVPAGFDAGHLRAVLAVLEQRS